MGGGVTAALSDLVISSRTWTTQNFTIEGNPVSVTAALNGLYLIHPTASLDLLARFVVAMTAGTVGSPAAFITQAGYVRLTGAGVFEVDWTGATTLRDLLGFTGTLSGASAYTAPNRSPLLWNPAKYLTFELSPRATTGQSVLDISATWGAGGNGTVRQEGAATVLQRFSARHIPKAKFRTTTASAAGEWHYFWANELTALRRFIVLMDVTIGDSTTTSMSYGSSTHVGPYLYDMSDAATRRSQFSRDSGFERVEAYYPVSFPGVITSEYA